MEFTPFMSVSKLESKKTLPIIGIAVAVSLFYASYRIFTTTNSVEREFKKIPTPGSAYPYIGHMMSLGELPGRTVMKWHKELGPIIKLQMGIQTWIMIDDPVLAHKIFVTNGAETSYRPHNTYGHNLYSLGGKGITFSQPDGRLKISRSAALTLLSPKYIEKHIPIINKESKNLVCTLIQCTKSEGGVDPFKHLELFGINTISEPVFGRTFDSVNNTEFRKLVNVSESITAAMGLENDLPNFLPIVSIYDYFFSKQKEQKQFLLKEHDPLLKNLIEEASRSETPNVIRSLIEDKFGLSDEEILLIASNLVVAGTDTIPNTLLWNIALMCHYPEIQEKAAIEIDKFIELNGRMPSFQERSELPYCITIIKESMRFRPTTSLGLPHTVHNNLIVDDYLIPKGSIIISSMESMHMNPDVYPEPEKFMPERFNDNTKTMYSAANGKLEGRDHYNFGWGRRICPAIYLAEAELFSAFVHIFAKCYVKPTKEGLPDIQNARNIGVAVSPLSYKVKFIERTN